MLSQEWLCCIGWVDCLDRKMSKDQPKYPSYVVCNTIPEDIQSIILLI